MDAVFFPWPAFAQTIELLEDFDTFFPKRFFPKLDEMNFAPTMIFKTKVKTNTDQPEHFSAWILSISQGLKLLRNISPEVYQNKSYLIFQNHPTCFSALKLRTLKFEAPKRVASSVFEGIWWFPRMVVPQNGWFMMENLMKIVFKHFQHMPIPPPMGLTYFSLHEFLKCMVNAGKLCKPHGLKGRWETAGRKLFFQTCGFIDVNELQN